MIGIYKFTDKIEHKSYIGQSVDIDRRYKEYKTRDENTLFHRMLKHYGFWNFDFEILEECNRDELDEKEKYYIKEYNTLCPNGYNLTPGGRESVHPNSLKSFDDVVEISRLLKETSLSNIEIGNMFGISDQMVSDINSGRSWFRDDCEYPIRRRTKNTFRCNKCGSKLYEKTKTGLCWDCYNHDRAKQIPNADALQSLLFSNSFNEVARMFNVSSNTIRKWCRKRGIPSNAGYYRPTSA